MKCPQKEPRSSESRYSGYLNRDTVEAADGPGPGSGRGAQNQQLFSVPVTVGLGLGDDHEHARQRHGECDEYCYNPGRLHSHYTAFIVHCGQMLRRRLAWASRSRSRFKQLSTCRTLKGPLASTMSCLPRLLRDRPRRAAPMDV
jgi:hypothetical protein